MSKAHLVLALALALFPAACSQTSGAAPSSASSAAPAAASGPCLDREALADDASTVNVALEGIAAALKTGDDEGARSMATNAVSGLRTLAGLVEPTQPDAATGFRSAADKLEAAIPAFPDGAQQVTEVQTAFDAAYQLARTVVCPA